MIYRTLHTYILRELLRIFLMTAGALTTLMAFGGMFRPVTKQGIEIQQLMVIMVNLMPAMLAYAIPISALFAAVLVYWRMSTDNELTACRAGGVSFISIVKPAFILGLTVALVDVLFLNYVVPRYLQAAERAIMRDLGSLLVSQIGRQERFQYGPLVVTADAAQMRPTEDPHTSVVVLQGMAGSYLDASGRPSATAVAQEARVVIRNIPGQDAAEIDIRLTNATGFDPGNAFRRVTGSVNTLSPDGRLFRVPSYFRSKPKFLNLRDLIALRQDPYLFPTVGEAIDRIEVAYDYQQISQNVARWWRASRGPQGEVSFQQTIMGGNALNRVTLHATDAVIDNTAPPQDSLRFTGGPQRVRVEQFVNNQRSMTYVADHADLALFLDAFTGTGIGASLQLQGNVTRENHELGLKPVATDATSLSGLILDAALKVVPKPAAEPHHADKAMLLKTAEAGSPPGMLILIETARQRIARLERNIKSELHSRGSFALSCLTLVLLGAALGILLKGKNPLAVFVVGFVPAVILVLLITAGRQLTEGHDRNVTAGIILIWAGNAVLLALVASVYGVLLRK